MGSFWRGLCLARSLGGSLLFLDQVCMRTVSTVIMFLTLATIEILRLWQCRIVSRKATRRTQRWNHPDRYLDRRNSLLMERRLLSFCPDWVEVGLSPQFSFEKQKHCRLANRNCKGSLVGEALRRSLPPTNNVLQLHHFPLSNRTSPSHAILQTQVGGQPA